MFSSEKLEVDNIRFEDLYNERSDAGDILQKLKDLKEGDIPILIPQSPPCIICLHISYYQRLFSSYLHSFRDSRRKSTEQLVSRA